MPTKPPSEPTKKKPAAKAPAQPAAPPPPAKAGAKKAAGAGAPNALQTPLTPSAELAAVVGAAPLSRGAVVSKMWEYIKLHKLQNPSDGREILADAALKKIFGKDKVTMFEMNKHLAQHLS